MPVNFDLKTLGSGNYNISGSLSQAKAAIVRHPLSLDGSNEGTVEINNSRFDVWFEASYNRFKGSQGSNGHFGIGYLGADYLYSKDLLVGFLVQFDDIEDRSITLNKTVSGTGWMAGPYVTARLAPNLYFDGRFAIGRSNNFLNLDLNNTTGLASGNFDTSRWLIDASLVGDVNLGKWQMQPNFSVSYMEESQKAFVDSLNVSQPGQTVSQGQVRLGPNFSTRIENDNGTVFEPSFTFDGIFSFGNRDGTLATSVTDETDGLRGRVEAGVTITSKKNVRVELGLNYDGIGKSDYESYGARLKFSMPF
jgi:outer membrane autotransporter protein